MTDLSVRTTPRRIYVLIAFVLLVACGTIAASVLLIDTMDELSSSLSVHARDIRTEAALAHLWAEELIDGDPDVDPADIEKHFSAADRAVQLLAERLSSARRNIFLSSLSDIEPLLAVVSGDLAATRDIARTRIASPGQSKSGSPLDQRNDEAFHALMSATMKLEGRLFAAINAQRRTFHAIQSVLVGMSIIFAILSALAVRRHDRMRAADFAIIADRNGQLRANEQQLLASNQQLRATEQQLRASNQQLLANEQQLRASNQQLRATEQQLRATNQQLLAHQQALASSERRYRMLFSNMGEGVALHTIIHAPDGSPINYEITDVNAQYEAIIGIGRDQAVGKLSTDVYGTPRPPYLEEYARVAETGVPFRFEAYFPPLGRHYQISVSSFEPGSFATIFSDVTEQKKAEEILRKNEVRLASLLEISQYRGDSLHDLFDFALAKALALTASSNGCLFLYNPDTCRLELSSSSCAGRPGCSRSGEHAECLVEEMGLLRDATLRKAPIILNDMPADASAHAERPFSRCMIVPLLIEDRVVAVVAVAHRETPYETTDVRQLTLMMDTVMRIAERKRIEEETGLLETRMQKLESLGVLAGGIAHDFNNLLTAVLANISLAALSARDQTDVTRRLTEAERAVLRARDLTQQLLTFAKGGAPVKKIADLATVIQDACHFAVRGTNARCDFAFAPDLWHAEVDSGQIGQAINNLVINAVQAMPSGGVVAITSNNFVAEPDSDFRLQPGRYIRTTIRDNGIGIPSEYLQKIFDPYFTTKQKGSGLGLAVTHSIIRNHAGAITVDSSPGVGTAFDIFLPAAHTTAPAEHWSNRTVPTGSGRILIMDDEEFLRSTGREILETAGYDVAAAPDGDEAIRLYKEARDAGRPFDLVILDLTIPGGMGGRETLDNLRSIDPEVKAIVSSGYSNDPIMSDYGKFGFRGIIAKPYKIEDFFAAVTRVLGEQTKR